jgi:signal transduction histidine kinase
LLNIRRDAISGASSQLRVSEWSVRRKVVAVLAIPVIVATVFGGLRVSTELNAASTYSTNQQRATVLGPAVEYLAAAERLTLPTTLSGRMGSGTGTPDQEFDSASTSLKAAAASANLNGTQSQLVADMTQVGAQIRSGSGVGINASAPVEMTNIQRDTTALINSTLSSTGTLPQVQALVQSLTGQLSLARQQLLIQSSAQQPSLLGSVWLAAEIGVEGAALDNLSANVGGRRVQNLVSDNTARLGQATSAHPKDLVATPGMFATYRSLNSNLVDRIDALIGSRADAAKARALTDTGIILGALVASLMLALLVARALIVPLRKVRAGALEVAHVSLPETVRRIREGKEPDELTKIDVHTKEELGQLARAVDDMHQQAVSLATGEAQLRTQVGAMFVTLSRRNTTLVNQQLALIESLEQDEEDPQRLEQLFSLDHLATRMRRTAESLVILGGTTGRTASFEELSVSDVIHAAVSEVQDYQRVRIDAAPDKMISGRAAADVVHLMAELIDNALSYSPPGSPVTIQAAEEDGRVEIEVIDSGLGMAGDALARANESLKSGGEVTIDTARRMGLFVVSRLAEEHGLRVKLRRNVNGGGIIASIILPSDVLATDEPVEHVSILDAPEQVEPPAPVVEDDPDEDYDPYLERIEEAIAAVTGLPRRRPGFVGHEPEPVPTPAAAVSMFEAPASALDAVVEPIALPGMHDDTETLEPGVLDGAPIALPTAEETTEETLAQVVSPDFGTDRHRETTDASYDVDETSTDEPETEVVAHEDAEQSDETRVHQPEPAETVVEAHVDDETTEQEFADEPAEAASTFETEAEPAEEPVLAEAAPSEDAEPEPAVPLAPVALVEAPAPTDAPAPVVSDMPVRLKIRRPLAASAAASALEGDHVVADEEPQQTPIFGQLRSNWLNDESDSTWVDPEIERGWDAADRSEGGDTEGVTPTGLPVRRPGGRLVPGGMSSEPTAVTRDPEAIRNRLAAHAAGVSRGRAAASAQPITTDYEETGPA